MFMRRLHFVVVLCLLAGAAAAQEPPPTADQPPPPGTGGFSTNGKTFWQRSISLGGQFTSAPFQQGALTPAVPGLTGALAGLPGNQYATQGSISLFRSSTLHALDFEASYTYAVVQPTGTVQDIPKFSVDYNFRHKEQQHYFLLARYASSATRTMGPPRRLLESGARRYRPLGRAQENGQPQRRARRRTALRAEGRAVVRRSPADRVGRARATGVHAESVRAGRAARRLRRSVQRRHVPHHRRVCRVQGQAVEKPRGDIQPDAQVRQRGSAGADAAADSRCRHGVRAGHQPHPDLRTIAIYLQFTF